MGYPCPQLFFNGKRGTFTPISQMRGGGVKSESYPRVAEVNPNLFSFFNSKPFAHTKYSSQTTMFLSTATRMVFLETEVDDFMSLLKTLHWLLSSLRIKSKKLTGLTECDFLQFFFPQSPHRPPCCSSNIPNMAPPRGLGIRSFPCPKRAFPRCPGAPSLTSSIVAPKSLSLRGFSVLWYETALCHPPVTVLHVSPPDNSYL